MGPLIAHIVGDYVLQSAWIAARKTSSLAVAALHSALYVLPFLALTRSVSALAVIAGTHALIDRYRLTAWWCRLWGIGAPGRLWPVVEPPAPPFLAVWLGIIVDNAAHLAINAAALRWL